ncbi:Bor family protein [Cyclobacterium marinum]|uniref:Bor family protein n=1 Tax=Cyclobacterium marinum TaxID=104 RepID=UPI0011EBE909|nr:Bor family protein [Cyclobacterium marinum]MBI0401272.1 Bor family protein [Cyclobacterium marinum]
MKKIFSKTMSLLLITSFLMTSCYTYTSVVGEGAQGNKETTVWNHYVVYGLAPVAVSDSKEMAGGAENYEVKTEQTFVNGLISALTFGIYTPTTTTVKR